MATLAGNFCCLLSAFCKGSGRPVQLILIQAGDIIQASETNPHLNMALAL